MSTKKCEQTLELKLFRHVLGNYYAAECSVRKELSKGHYYPKWFAYLLVPAMQLVVNSYDSISDDCKSRLLDYETELVINVTNALRNYVSDTTV